MSHAGLEEIFMEEQVEELTAGTASSLL
jgi:hypothetical protein